MFIFSTILYFGDEPAGYTVYKETNGYIFRSSIDNNNENIPPIIKVQKKEGGWSINIEGQEELQAQISRILDMNANLNMPGYLSAAS